MAICAPVKDRMICAAAERARLPNDPGGSNGHGEPPAVSIAAKHAHVGGLQLSEAGSQDKLADFRIVICVVLDRTARQQVGGSTTKGSESLASAQPSYFVRGIEI
jgi:hypothetical protein